MGIRVPKPLLDEMKKSDLMICLGERLSDSISQSYTFPAAPDPQLPLVQVWPDANEIGRVWRVDLPIAADPHAVIRGLLARNAPEPSEARRTWVKGLNTIHRGLLAPEWDGLAPDDRAFFGSFEEHNPEWTLGTWTPDLSRVAEAFASEKIELLRQFLRFPYNVLSELPGGDQYTADKPRGLTAQLPDWAWLIVGDEIKSALQAGFYFAVKRYADELRQVPELTIAIERMHAQRSDAGKKRGAARKRDAEKQRQQAVRIDNELRELPQFKTQASRNAEIASLLGKDIRTIQNYLSCSKTTRSRRK
jgi:hypothetical protein